MKALIIIVFVLTAIVYFLSRKKTRNGSARTYRKLTPVNRVYKKGNVALNNFYCQESPAEKFFNDSIEKYQKKLLSYYILRQAEEAGFTAEQRIKLTNKYGLVSLMPMLSVELSGIKAAGLRHAEINLIADNWLSKNAYAREGFDNIESIEIILQKEMLNKAIELIKTIDITNE